ncbi:uncharacterized protein LODBEIA_P09890 [Lodderomyces beijingensis]|uniref:Kinetochore protein NDC80 n=1 Tax=Lodderomyces beijingensis TaxID=1775926 RepID=A0ABP0ZKG0_9ASCO
MQKDILAFLVSHRFEAVSTTPLNENILKSPTQRNFNDIFKFIILTIEPGYVFEKPVEQEIIPILKSYQYPYLNTISRSNFSAVGGQNNWPTFLGLLHWLVELSELLSNGLTDSSYEPDDDFDKIFVKCTMDCYGKFLREDENYEQEREEMEQRFALELQSYKNLIEEGAKRNLALEEKYAQLTAELKAKEEADRKTIALEDDHEKLKNYINQVKKMIPEWKTKLDLGERELEMLNEKLKQLHHEKATLDTELAKRGISIESVNKIHYERDSLSKANDAAHARVENIKDKLATRIFELETNLDELEGVLSEYNTSVQRLNYEDETKFQFGLKIKEDIQNTDRAFGRDEILANKTTNEEKTQLMAVLEQLRFQIAEDTKKIQTVKQESVGVQEMINSQRARVEDLQIQDTLAKRKCDEISHNFSRQQDDYMTQIEQTEQRARDIKMAMSSAVLNLERKLQDANIEHNATIEAIENKRREMGESLDKVVSYVLKFKLNVSERLMIMDDSMQKQQQSD